MPVTEEGTLATAVVIRVTEAVTPVTKVEHSPFRLLKKVTMGKPGTFNRVFPYNGNNG